MTLLAIDRSTDTQSAALLRDGRAISKVFQHADSRSADWPVSVGAFLAAAGVDWSSLDRIVVGQGPGSFGGVRAALAFAQGVAIGRRGGAPADFVCGLPSAVALTRDGARIAVVGDARRGRYWVALYDGVRPVGGFALVPKEGLQGAVPEGYSVVTPDGDRIDALLASVFAHRYRGSAVPLASRLAEVAAEAPELLVPEPLPIYLQGAVRTD